MLSEVNYRGQEERDGQLDDIGWDSLRRSQHQQAPSNLPELRDQLNSILNKTPADKSKHNFPNTHRTANRNRSDELHAE